MCANRYRDRLDAIAAALGSAYTTIAQLLAGASILQLEEPEDWTVAGLHPSLLHDIGRVVALPVDLRRRFTAVSVLVAWMQANVALEGAEDRSGQSALDDASDALAHLNLMISDAEWILG